MAFCKLLTVLVLIHNTGGLLGAEVKSSIIGGKDAEEGKWPWMVHLNITSNGIDKWRCSGTILGDEWVLTAASCWDEKRKPDLRRSFVRVGSYNLHEGARYIGVKTVIKHDYYPSFNGGNHNNIALVWLNKSLAQDVKKQVGLPTANDNFDASSDCWIAGWGYIGKDEPLPPPETLQELKVKISTDESCKKEYPWMTPKELCAGGMDTCTGDEGGPLMCRDGDHFVQVGIMSYESCGDSNRHGLYTRVSKYLDFIRRKVYLGEEASAEI